MLVACVGNLLRTDDGFGPAVADQLVDMPSAVRVVETGIGGMAIVHELDDPWEGLVIVDSVDRGAAPGTLFVLEPEITARHVDDVHLANPEMVLAMAKGLGRLPERVRIVGCQPAVLDEYGQRLSPAVQRAVGPGARCVREIVDEWLG